MAQGMSIARQRRGIRLVLALAMAAPAAGAAELPPIVFVSRTVAARSAEKEAERSAVETGRGKLLVLEGVRVRPLVDGTRVPTDVLDPSLHWDASKVVFAGFVPAEAAWRIFEVRLDGTGLRQVTRSDRQVDLRGYGAMASRFESYDDLDPCYLGDGRICFVSTRYPGAAPGGRQRATNLYVVDADGSGVRRITTERFGADTPAVDPETGRIVYSRWWRTARPRASEQTAAEPGAAPKPPPPPAGYYGPDLPAPEFPGVLPVNPESLPSHLPLRGIEEADYPGVNSWFLASIKPDGTELAMFSGFRLDREATQAYRPSFLPGGAALALFLPESPWLGVPGRNGLRRFQRGASQPEALGGPQTFRRAPAGEIPFVYSSAEPLAGGRFLVSAAPADGSPLEYDIYVQPDGHGEPIRLFGETGIAELDAVPVVARPAPPIPGTAAAGSLADDVPRTAAAAYARGTFRFVSENIFFNGPAGMPIATAPPIGKRLAIEFYMAPELSGELHTSEPILLKRLAIPPDGRVEAELPVGVPLFELIRREDGKLAMGRDGQIYHVGGMNFGIAGQSGRCVGCHAGHTLIDIPLDASWANIAPSAVASATLSRADTPLFFAPKSLVDRRTDPVVGEWAAGFKIDETHLQLRWSTLIEAQAVVLHGTQTGKGLLGDRFQTIARATVTTFRDERVVDQATLVGPVRVPGTGVALDPARPFDKLVVTIRGEDVAGVHEGLDGPALAEIEVIGRAASLPVGTTAPFASLIRGDANCDARVDLADAVTTLGNLFRGENRHCCAEAADSNGDAAINLTDPVHLLNFLFREGAPPAKPFPTCGRVAESTLGCDEEICP